MKKNIALINASAAKLFVTAIATFTSCGNSNFSALQAKVYSLQKELKKFTGEKALTGQRLLRFDSLDFDFYSGQKWNSFAISHADNIKVYYPDGSSTEG
jgi:hypothetical protein